MTTPSTDEREQLARLLFSRLSLHPIKDLYDTRSHSEGTRNIWREEADAILHAGFRLPVPTTPTHRCVNCKREWQETQLEVWQGFPVQHRCPECKSACAKMDPVPTTTPIDHDAARKLAEKILSAHDLMPHWNQDAALLTLARAYLDRDSGKLRTRELTAEQMGEAMNLVGILERGVIGPQEVWERLWDAAQEAPHG